MACAPFICLKCWDDQEFSPDRSIRKGETALRFSNGHIWRFPDLILHYIRDHNWVPPDDFVQDVFSGQQVFYSALNQECICRRVGYLAKSEVVSGSPTVGLADRLEVLMIAVSEHAELVAYRGPGDK